MLNWLIENPNAAVVCGVCLISFFIAIPKAINPNTILYLAFSNVAKRLYHESNSSQYNLFASSFALLLFISTVCIIVFGLLSFAYYPLAIECILLFLCIDNPLAQTGFKQLHFLLKHKQKLAARDTLKPWLRREVNQLTESGIIKAAIETKLLRYVRLVFTPLFLYYLFGIEIVLVYKLLSLFQQSWSHVTLPDSSFLKPVNCCISLLEYIPIRLFCLPVIIQKPISLKLIKHYAQQCYNQSTGWLLSCACAYLKCQLGGPAFYHHKRYEKIRVSHFVLPKVNTLTKINTLLLSSTLFWGCIMIIMELMYAFIR